MDLACQICIEGGEALKFISVVFISFEEINTPKQTVENYIRIFKNLLFLIY